MNIPNVFSDKACFNRCAIRVGPNPNQDGIKGGVSTALYTIEALGPYGFGSYRTEGNHSVIPTRLEETENYTANLCGDFRSVIVVGNNDPHYGVNALRLTGGFTQLYVQGDKDYEKIKHINTEKYFINLEAMNAPRHRLSGFYRCVELKMPGGWWRINYPYLRSVRFRGWPINPVDTHRDRHTESIDYLERPDHRLEYGPLWEEKRGLVNLQQAAENISRLLAGKSGMGPQSAMFNPPIFSLYTQNMQEEAKEQYMDVFDRDLDHPPARPDAAGDAASEAGPLEDISLDDASTAFISSSRNAGQQTSIQLANMATEEGVRTVSSASQTITQAAEVTATMAADAELSVEGGILAYCLPAALVPGAQPLAVISFIVTAISIAATGVSLYTIFSRLTKHGPPPPAPKHDPIDDECPQGDQRCREIHAKERHKEYKNVYKNYRRGVIHLKSHLKPQLTLAAAPIREPSEPPAPVAAGAGIIDYRAGETYPYYEDCGWPFFLIDGNFFEIEIEDQTLGSQLLIQGPCTQIRIWNTNRFPYLPPDNPVG